MDSVIHTRYWLFDYRCYTDTSYMNALMNNLTFLNIECTNIVARKTTNPKLYFINKWNNIFKQERSVNRIIP